MDTVDYYLFLMLDDEKNQPRVFFFQNLHTYLCVRVCWGRGGGGCVCLFWLWPFFCVRMSTIGLGVICKRLELKGNL